MNRIAGLPSKAGVVGLWRLLFLQQIILRPFYLLSLSLSQN